MVEPVVVPSSTTPAEKNAGTGSVVAGGSYHLRRWTRRAGDRAPDFHLPGRHGQIVSLSQKLTAGPVILAFFQDADMRAIRSQLDALARHADDINRLGASILALAPILSPALVSSSAFDLLHDDGSIVAGIYGLYGPVIDDLSRDSLSSRRDDDEQRSMPATFVIDRDSRIVMSLADTSFDNAIVPENVVSTLTALRRRKGDTT